MADLYFGGMFPAPGGTTPVPAVAAQLSLEDPVTISSALQNVIIRARAAGVGGNAILFNIDAGTLADGGEIIEDVGAHTVTLRFNDGDFASDIFATINATSTLVEAVGFPNPGDQLFVGEDNFDRPGGPGPIFLEGGLGATSEPNNGYWDGHFPFSVEDEPDVPPATPEGAATFALRLENGLKVTYRWLTDVEKWNDGKENRINLRDDPSEFYEGTALLVGDEVLTTRAAIAQHAANGGVFSLALPYEETTIVEVAGAVVTLEDPTSSLDWAVIGQRVMLMQGAGNDIEVSEGVIQAVGTDSVTLDAAPAVSDRGALVMPLVPVLLDPQQNFARYRSGTERWQLKARAAVFGFPAAATRGELVKTIAGETVTFTALTAGIGVGLSLAVSGSGILIGIAPGDDGGFNLAVTVESGTTLEELKDELEGILEMGFDSDAAITAPDAFTLTAFTGANAGGPSDQGRGATVTQLLGKPLWDRELMNPSTITDSVHSSTRVVDLDGVPTVVVEATVPDWGRTIQYADTDWQWMKAFLAAVKGRWKTFYLPTNRADLQPIGSVVMNGPDDYTITIDAAVGNYPLWTARGYSVLQVTQGEDVHYVQVEADGSDGETFTLDVEGAELAEAPIDRLSWVELVRLERDEVDVTWSATMTFAVSLLARVVQQ